MKISFIPTSLKFCALTFFKFFLTPAALLFIGLKSYAQVGFGLKSGVNIATTKGYSANPKNKLGWYGGGFVKVPIGKKLFLQPELIYSSKGQRTSYEAGGDSKSVTRLNYLNFPVLVGYKIDHRTFFLLGPEIGYLVSAQLKYYSEFMDVTKNYPPKLDAGLAVGIDYSIVKKVGIGVRYIFGFNTLYSVDAVGNRHNENNGANRTFQIGMNYTF